MLVWVSRRARCIRDYTLGVMKSEFSFERILVVGDTHTNGSWLRDVVLPSAAELEVPGIVIIGDFGYWEDGATFLRIAREAEKTHGLSVLFLDGNHENHELLRRDVEEFGGDLDNTRRPVWMGGGLVYLPRGSHFSVGGLDVEAFGGAASIDKGWRRAGESWFLEELITDADLAFAAKADVMLTHDAPSGWEIPGLPSRWGMDRAWLAEIPNCEAHRLRLREAFDVAQPSVLIHGHYHSQYNTTVYESWGAVEIVGLNRDTYPGWGAVLESRNGVAYVDQSSELLRDTVPWSLRSLDA